MTWHIHELRGCTPTPLAGYLKALGVLRVIATQLDPDCRASWKHGHLTVVSRLSLDDLCAFFADAYKPTAIVTPWNADGGFIAKKSEDIKALSESTPLEAQGDRFNRYLSGLHTAAAAVAGRSESPKDDEKLAVFTHARANWDDDALAWLDAVVALLPEQDKARYPALLASGGCDGRLDFGATFRRRLTSMFGNDKKTPSADAIRSWVRASLTGEGIAQLPGESAGQFDPGSTSPVNGGAGYRGNSVVNPWDFILAFEGIPVMRVAVARRLRADVVSTSSPFSVRGTAAGYASASAKDTDGRGEQWLPLWNHAASLDEVRALFAEGRMLSGTRTAGNALDAARAIARLGVARGIGAFERYGYVPRNGQSSLAVPLGRWQVSPNPQVRLLDEIDAWLDRLSMKAGEKAAPGSLGRDVRRIESAMLEVCRPDATAHRWQELLIAIGDAEHHLGNRPKFTKEQYLQPAPPLSAGWLLACADGSPEVRLAAAIGLAGLPLDAHGTVAKALGPIRMHTLPLDGDRGWRTFKTGDGGLAKDPRVVWSGRDLVEDLVAVVTRRALEGEKAGASGFMLDGPLRVSLSDVAAFLAGQLDDNRIASLARGFMTLGRQITIDTELRERLGRPSPQPIPPLFALLRLTHLPRNLAASATRRTPPLRASVDPAITRLLMAGRLAEAIEAARRRLRGQGLTSRLRFGLGSPELARRMAAALALPLSESDLQQLVARAAKPFDDDSHDSA